MQRFVYNPKAYVFIKQRNGNIADVSPYCTAGSVNRRVNAASTANFTLRNPDMLFTAQGGDSASFYPMDPITIYLQRLRGRPVRVFTGFLDETPYYEMYPGVVEFSATCTLKKLLYTYFDPSLTYTISFLAEYGWTAMNDGTVQNLPAQQKALTDKDGGMGALLYATLQHIGNWDKDHIKIEKLPDDLVTRMANMHDNFTKDNEVVMKELEELIRNFVGAGDYGNSGGDSSSVDTSKYDGDVAEVVYQVGKALNASPKLMLAAFETGIVESGMKNLTFGDRDSKGWRQERTSIYGDGADGATNVNASARRYFTEGKNIIAGKAVGKANTGSYSESWSAGKLAQAIQGSAFPDRYDEQRAAANALLEKTKDKVESRDGVDNDTSSDKAQRAQRRDGRDNKGDSSKDAANRTKLSKTVDVHGAQEGMQVMANLAASYKLQVTAGKNDHSTMTASGNVSDHSTGSALDVSNGTSPTPQMDAFNQFVKDKLEPITKQLIWRDKDQHNGYPIGGHMNHVHIALKPEFASSKEKTLNAVVDALAGRDLDIPDDAQTDGGGGDGGADSSGIMPEVKANILAAQLTWDAWAGNVEAQGLQGNKSLMNDKPLMPFIQQMSEGSMRQFMSMPNGDFFAFYPDYFGETYHRPPYWIIDDIEILEGRVKLNDAALVTHAFVVGDTSGTHDPMTNKLMSAGAVSIFNAFQSNLVTTETDKKKTSDDKATREEYNAFSRILKQDEAQQFLERYGARPDYQDYPFIRNAAYELFMAYQRFMQAWGRQFLTPFKLTFMPELYPGGKVGFPEHGLQMYVEEVTHSWDYASGFVTEADLSSPAVMRDSAGQPISDNLPPNMPTALLEVAAEKTPKSETTPVHPNP